LVNEVLPMGWLYNQIALTDTLFEAWEKVASNDGRAGIGGLTIADYSLCVEQRLKDLSAELLTGTYQPHPLLKCHLQKPNGGLRTLQIPTVRDRVAQTAAALVLAPIINAQLSSCTFAYRAGLSRMTAADEIEKLRNDGYQYVLDADIRNFFDSVQHPLLLTRLSELIDDQELISLITRWLTAETVEPMTNTRSRNAIGLPQGTPIAPVLANLYLDKFDDALEAEGFKLIRFADDFLVLCKTRPHAEAALKLSESVLKDLRLELHPDKTRITTFAEGFKYLGYLFIRSLVLPTKMHPEKWYDKLGHLRLRKLPRPLPPDGTPLPDEFEHPDDKFELNTGEETLELSRETISQTEFGRKLLESLSASNTSIDAFLADVQKRDAVRAVEKTEALKRLYSPFLRTLYLQTQGSYVRKESERILIEKEDKVLTEVQANKVEQIIVFGNISLTTPVMQFCLQRQIPIAFLSQTGNYFGRLEATTADNTASERHQYLRSLDETFSLETARAIIAAKIHNSRVMIQRRRATAWGADYELKEHFERHLALMAEMMAAAEAADSFETLRGYEGKAAAVYFELFGLLFKKDGAFYTDRFRRIRRPPTDPVNSLLSFAYTLLHANLFSIARLHGLSPYIGFLHAEEKGNPALINDLMEEFRTVMDSLVLYTLNRGLLKQRDFFYAKDHSACFLSDDARKRFLEIFESRMQEESAYKQGGVKLNFRRILEAQVKQMKAVIMDKRPMYEPYRTPI